METSRATRSSEANGSQNKLVKHAEWMSGARLRALRLARDEARWMEHRQKTVADIKSGLVELREKTGAPIRTDRIEPFSRDRRLLAIRAFLTGQALLSTFQTP
jgi:hypothetical protein